MKIKFEKEIQHTEEDGGYLVTSSQGEIKIFEEKSKLIIQANGHGRIEISIEHLGTEIPLQCVTCKEGCHYMFVGKKGHTKIPLAAIFKIPEGEKITPEEGHMQEQVMINAIVVAKSEEGPIISLPTPQGALFFLLPKGRLMIPVAITKEEKIVPLILTTAPISPENTAPPEPIAELEQLIPTPDTTETKPSPHLEDFFPEMGDNENVMRFSPPPKKPEKKGK